MTARFSFRLLVFLDDEGRVSVRRYENLTVLRQALGAEELAGRRALALEVVDIVHGGDEAGWSVTDEPPVRSNNRKEVRHGSAKEDRSVLPVSSRVDRQRQHRRPARS